MITHRNYTLPGADDTDDIMKVMDSKGQGHDVIGRRHSDRRLAVEEDRLAVFTAAICSRASLIITA